MALQYNMQKSFKIPALLYMALACLPVFAADPDIPALPMVQRPAAIHLICNDAGLSDDNSDARLKIHVVSTCFCDFNGDGYGDIALFDGFTGYWHCLNARGGCPVFWALPWGWPGSEPVPGDYDGDRIADLCVFNPDQGLWAVCTAAGRVLFWEKPWGWPGCIPVPGDYDGDGKSDFAFFDPATAQWYIRTASGLVLLWAFPWGWPASQVRPAAVPESGDVNGDGCSDLILRDSKTGRRYVCEVSGNVLEWDK